MNLPDCLAVFRVILIPVFILVLTLSFPTGSFDFTNVNAPLNQVLAAVIFAGTSYTDYLDGHIARTRGLMTNFRKFADSLADRVLVTTAFVFLVDMGKAPMWIVAIIVCRESAVTELCLILVENDSEILAAKMPGGIRTATQVLSVIFLLLRDIFFIGTVLLYICLIFIIYSGRDYFYQFRDVFVGEL